MTLARLSELAGAQASRYHPPHQTCGDRLCPVCRQLGLGLDGAEGDKHLQTFVCVIESGQLVVMADGVKMFIGLPDELGFKAAGKSLAIALQIEASKVPS